MKATSTSRRYQRSDKVEVIAEASPLTLLIFMVAMATLFVWFASWSVTGEGASESMYYHVFGKALPYLGCAGSAYAIYEFAQTWRHRKTYVLRSGNDLVIFAYPKIPLSTISEVYVIKRMGIGQVMIARRNGQKHRVPATMLREAPSTVAERIRALL